MKMETPKQLQNIGPAIGKGNIIQVVKQYSNARSFWKSLYSFDQKYLFFFILAYHFEKTSVEFAPTHCSHRWL